MHPSPIPELIDGLAVYCLGEGAPVFVVPSPDGFTFTSSPCSPLAQQLLRIGRRVITFDPSGTHQSTRKAEVSMEDLLACTSEALDAAGISGPLDFAGEGMGALGALAFALQSPQLVKSLVLVGACSGIPAIRGYGGLPWLLPKTSRDFWRYVTWERKLSRGGGSLALHKQLLELVAKHAFLQQDAAPVFPPNAGDNQQPPPVRDRWRRSARNLDYRHATRTLRAPTLLCVGRYDRLAPVGCSQELAERIPASWLMIFENSGHFPQVEEPEAFCPVLAEFWRV
jgi:pimeloyl-ACP methyl ester carboxylesterase